MSILFEIDKSNILDDKYDKGLIRLFNYIPAIEILMTKSEDYEFITKEDPFVLFINNELENINTKILTLLKSILSEEFINKIEEVFINHIQI